MPDRIKNAYKYFYKWETTPCFIDSWEYYFKVRKDLETLNRKPLEQTRWVYVMELAKSKLGKEEI